jgi:hypothetical protein
VNDAMALISYDLRTLPPQDRIFQRFVWCPSGQTDDVKVLSFTLNTISRGSVIIRPTPLGRGKLLVARVDLRVYAPRAKDLNEWLRLWEEFQFDPALSLLITKGTLNLVQQSFPEWRGRGLVTRTEEGRRRTRVETVSVADLKDVELIRIPDPSLDVGLLAEVVGMTDSQSPLVSADYFIYRALSTIQDAGVFKEIYGGLYYEFCGIPEKSKKGTDLDNLLEQLGVGNVAQGVTAKVVFEKLRSDQRAAIFRSNVTGNPRQMEFFPTLAVRPDKGQGLATFTHDLKQQSIDIDTHPVANLLDFKADASEGIFETTTGLHRYVLYDGAGKLQREVPPDVANDSTIPPPHHQRLQPAISCISCHEGDGQSDGWKRVTNDVNRLVGKGRADIFGDLSRKNDTISDTLDRLAGLYAGDPERALQRGRDSYASAVLRATGPWKESEKGQTDAVTISAKRTVGNWRRFAYDLVDAQHALTEIGVEVADAADAVKVINELLMPDTRAAVNVPFVGVVVPEDPRTAALKAGIGVTRWDWGFASAFARERVRHNLAQVMQRSKN